MMSRLSAFLHPETVQETKEVVISQRFKDKDEKVVPFTIKALSQAENEAISKRCQQKSRGKDEIDNIEYTQRIVVAGTVEPNFADKELLAAFGPSPETPLLNPLELPGIMLRAGEYARLVKEIMELSGFDEDLAAAAKN